MAPYNKSLITYNKRTNSFDGPNALLTVNLTKSVIGKKKLKKIKIKLTCEPIFSDSFRERQTVRSSTPCMLAPAKIVADPISPIQRVASPNSSNLIKKSYDENKKWDSSYSDIEENTPKGPVLRSRTDVKNNAMRVRRKLSSAVNTEQQRELQDWKLNNSPKVYLVRCDAVGDFMRFTDSEKSKNLKPTKNGKKNFFQRKSVKNGRRKSLDKIDRKSTRRSSGAVSIKVNRYELRPRKNRKSTRRSSGAVSIKVNRYELRSRKNKVKNIAGNSLSNSAKKTPKSNKVDKQNPSSSQPSSSHLSDITESSSVATTSKDVNKSPISVTISIKPDVVDDKVREKPKSVTLKSGKSYRRSLNTKMCHRGDRRSSVIVPAKIEESSANKSVLEVYARNLCYVQEQQKHQQFIETDLEHDNSQLITAKDIVLRKCGQAEVLPFEKCYPRSALQHCQKIGEGNNAEVFLNRNQSGETFVMKIIPIEGDLIVSGEKQMKYEEIVTEIIISTELSSLRNNKLNCTSGFSEVKAVRCIQGCYPDKLLHLWNLYDENHGSENDSPEIFPPDQLYIVLEFSNGGQGLESYVFNNAVQAFSMFKQTACALAVAESQLKFEHRDLHWSNILIKTVKKDKSLQFRLNGQEIEVNTNGVETCIIDFTLSRVEMDGAVIFNDLSLDNDLFVAKGDYQHEIYRLIQEQNGNEWKHFEPYSNILWLHYLLDKAVSYGSLRYKNKRSKIHKEYIGNLKKIKKNILSYISAADFVLNTFL